MSGIITMDTINGIKLLNKVEQNKIVFWFSSSECKYDRFHGKCPLCSQWSSHLSIKKPNITSTKELAKMKK